jgi:metal-responsive CopG/Arc/MetJ family transcriptional regulator
MKTITVKLPEALAAWLTRRAGELGRPQSEVVRDALQRARDGAAPASCHDLMNDVCGTVTGPRDLSTHPKHMRGFGE